MNQTESPLSHCIREIRSEEEAHFAVLYGCIYADEEVAHEENERLINLFNNSKMFKGLGLISTWEHMRRLMNKYGEEILISASIHHLHAEVLEMLLDEVKSLLLADGPLSDREKIFLDRLGKRINGR